MFGDATMRFRPHILPALLLISSHASPATAQTTAEWSQDLDFLSAKLTGVHPEPFHDTSKHDFDAAVATLRKDMPQLTDAQITTRMMQLTALLDDGHTVLLPTGKVAGFDHWFPVRLQRFKEGWYVTAASKEHEGLIGDKVIRLGMVDMGTAAQRAMTAVSGDNVFGKLAEAPYIFAMPKALAALGINDTLDHLQLVTLDPAGHQGTATIEAVSRPFDLYWFGAGYGVPTSDSVHAPLVAGEKLDLPLNNLDQAYWYEYVPAGKLFYVNLKFILDGEKLKHLGYRAPAPTLAEFFDQMWHDADSRQIDRFVIDIRDNTGGDNSLLGPLLAGIASRPSLDAQGKLFLITGRRTYSAAMNLVTLMQDRTHVLLVGEAAGGSPKNYGDPVELELPNSGLSLSVSLYTWYLGVTPRDLRDRIQPDLSVAPSAADFFAGRDAVIPAILDYSSTSALPDRMLAAYKDHGLPASYALLEQERLHHPDSMWDAYDYILWQFAAKLSLSGAGDKAYTDALREATELYPRSSLAWYRLGRAYLEQEKWDLARTVLAKAQAIKPNEELVNRLLVAADKPR
jgi:hypothetical protein